MDIKSRVINILSRETHIATENINVEKKLNFNRMQSMFLVYELEEEFNIELDDEQLIQNNNINQIITLIESIMNLNK